MNRILIVILILNTNNVFSQTFFANSNYPTSFANPIKFPVQLVGNFGECRPNHFHSGLDIRTNSKENQLIYSIEDGYVSRVKIEAGGFGNAIYITHPGGYTSVYAHLNRFYPELEEYVRRKQYDSQHWEQDIAFMPHQFLLRRGSFIAWSGNTGSSQGPHLHMEIRDSKTEAPLNGLLFYKKFPDNKPPVIKQLAIYNGNKSIYEQSPVLTPVSKKGTIYKPTSSLIKFPSNKIYLGLNADDYMDISTGTLGVFEMRLFVNDEPYFGWQMDSISYAITRYMNAIADYKTKKNKGPWIQLCHKLPNDKLPVYKSFNNSFGMINLSSQTPSKIRIEALDAKGNKSTLEFEIISTGNGNAALCKDLLRQGKKNEYKDANIEFELDEDALYDDVCFSASMKESSSPISNLYQVHYSSVPVHTYFNLKLKPKTTIPASIKDKLAFVNYPFGSETSKKGKAAAMANNGMVACDVRDFGTYEIVVDETPPKITSTLKNGSNIAALKRLNFTIKEETTSVAKFKAEVDGQWLRLVQKGNSFFYEMDSHFPKGTHLLTISATDENNNTSKVNYTLTR